MVKHIDRMWVMVLYIKMQFYQSDSSFAMATALVLPCFFSVEVQGFLGPNHV